MIGAACESADKVLADTRKAYGFGARQGPPIVPTLDKGQAAKIQEQENLLRAAVNYGEGTIINGHSTVYPFFSLFFFFLIFMFLLPITGFNCMFAHLHI